MWLLDVVRDLIRARGERAARDEEEAEIDLDQEDEEEDEEDEEAPEFF